MVVILLVERILLQILIISIALVLQRQALLVIELRLVLQVMEHILLALVLTSLR